MRQSIPVSLHLVSPSEFPHTYFGNVVASYLFFSSESVKFFTMVSQITSSVSSFSDCLELFSDFGHISDGFSDVIPLAVSEYILLGNSYIFLPYL